ncbi:uncharacterized protein EDB91DRAFT_1252963 [Suillus paluster]|uniref:uncharacterized protein n=1 Tax=Suillus paluster TaxID=48578 RepID=UPI001B875E49|nr:uncharacterized protein EDB91DRAFT_1252963 [Suillus paluster]KAG1729645.1 hypothetical protein EDB91DRAFT_1252963 [Suillus paluster]
MTRTKQTCKKSTGGTAKRITVNYAPLLDFSSIGVDLGFDSSIGADLNSDLAMEETVKDEETGGEEVDKADGMDDGMGAGEVQSSHNEWCIVCRDGSSGHEFLYLCDLCPRTMCSRCVDIPVTHADAVNCDDVMFTCIYCHLAAQDSRTEETRAAYFGFYRNNLPVLPTFLPIHGALEVSLQSQISSTPVVLIHLTLVDFETSGRPFDLMYRFLSPYFPRGGIAFHELVFDIGSKVKSDMYQVKVGELVRSLMAQRNWPRIVFAISNHTDDDLGDPFLGYERKKKSYVSGRVDGFLDIILTPWQPLIRAAKDSYLWFLSCGALVNNKESFSSLQKAVLHHHITATICFNAIRFQPNFAAPLLLSFAELVLTECLPIREVFPDMLMQSYKLGRHTDVFLLMTNACHALDITRFAWTHCKERPWGHHLPLQCPQCGWANSWRSANHKKTYSFECMNSKCRKGYLFSPPENSVTLSHARKSGSCWIAVCVKAN